MEKQCKIVVVGLGLVGIRHLQAINAATNATVQAVIDISDESKQLASDYDVPHFESIEAMLLQLEPDGAIIATPNALHVPMALLFINAGIPVLIEKPLATEIEEAEKMLCVAAEKNVPVLTGYFRRYNPVVSAAKAQIQQGSIGEVVSVHCNFWLYKHQQYFDTQWRTQEQGGPIHINLAHDIDILLHLIGEITQVATYHSKQTRGLDVEDTAVLICRFKNGALGTINMSDTIPAPWSWELTAGDNPAYPQTDQSYCFIGGSKGSIELPKNKLWYYQGEKNWYSAINTKTFLKSVQYPLIAQIEHFGRVIAGEALPLVTGEDGLKVMKVIKAIKQSANREQTAYL